MRFYDCETAPSPRRVRIFAAEKGLELTTVPVDLASGEQFGPAYRRINSDCVVPALELDDGTCISEVVAICQYLEELHPEPPLLGRTPAERALVTMWNIKVEQQGLWPTADAFRNVAGGLRDRALPGPDDCAQIPELAARGRERAAVFLARLDDRLRDSEFVAGPNFSIADITALVTADFAGRLKITMPAPGGAFARWHALVRARPSAAA
jgi:glutathione S-transferase